MKIIINQDGIKRSLEGPFEICLSKDDLQTLLSCLRHHEDSHVYGWIVIQDNTVRSTPNSDPIPWYHSDLYPKYPCNYPGCSTKCLGKFCSVHENFPSTQGQ